MVPSRRRQLDVVPRRKSEDWACSSTTRQVAISYQVRGGQRQWKNSLEQAVRQGTTSTEHRAPYRTSVDNTGGDGGDTLDVHVKFRKIVGAATDSARRLVFGTPRTAVTGPQGALIEEPGHHDGAHWRCRSRCLILRATPERSAATAERGATCSVCLSSDEPRRGYDRAAVAVQTQSLPARNVTNGSTQLELLRGMRRRGPTRSAHAPSRQGSASDS